MKYCFGVDIGGTTVKLGLFTTEGEIVDKWEIKTRTENQGEAVLPDIAAALNEKLEEKQIPKDEVEGIGVGVPAPVDSEGVVQNTANLGWGYKEVKREIPHAAGRGAPPRPPHRGAGGGVPPRHDGPAAGRSLCSVLCRVRSQPGGDLRSCQHRPEKR